MRAQAVTDCRPSVSSGVLALYALDVITRLAERTLVTPVSRSVSDPLETGRRDGCGDRDRDSRRAVGAQVQRQVRPEVAQLRTAGEAVRHVG